jgi:hypothetical protein
LISPSPSNPFEFLSLFGNKSKKILDLPLTPILVVILSFFEIITPPEMLSSAFGIQNIE